MIINVRKNNKLEKLNINLKIKKKNELQKK